MWIVFIQWCLMPFPPDSANPSSECPVCQQASWSTYLVNRDRLYPEEARKEYDLYRCNTCHLVKILPELSPDEIKTFYPIDYMAYDSPQKIERTKFRQRLREGILAFQLNAGKPMWAEFKNIRIKDIK